MASSPSLEMKRKECGNLANILPNIDCPISLLAKIIDRSLQYIADKELDSIHNIDEARQGVIHWADMAKRLLALSFGSDESSKKVENYLSRKENYRSAERAENDELHNSIRKMIGQIYADSMLDPKVCNNSKLMEPSYKSIWTMMHAALHIGWYQVFRLQSGRAPAFLGLDCLDNNDLTFVCYPRDKPFKIASGHLGTNCPDLARAAVWTADILKEISPQAETKETIDQCKRIYKGIKI